MTLYHFGLGALYGALAVLMVASLAASMLSSWISREEEGRGNEHVATDETAGGVCAQEDRRGGGVRRLL